MSENPSSPADEVPLVEGMESLHENAGGFSSLEGERPTDTAMAMVPQAGGSQLTLSFQGEVYVFDCVSPEKVQSVLLLLGGREVAAPLPSQLTSSNNQMNKRYNFSHRIASLMRFREKRKERNFDKKIRYDVRKEVALSAAKHLVACTSSCSVRFRDHIRCRLLHASLQPPIVPSADAFSCRLSATLLPRTLVRAHLPSAARFWVHICRRLLRVSLQPPIMPSADAFPHRSPVTLLPRTLARIVSFPLFLPCLLSRLYVIGSTCCTSSLNSAHALDARMTARDMNNPPSVEGLLSVILTQVRCDQEA
ncbi:GATA transcription factor 28 [Platanthera guangdongensis]|uniref:GATA transcription factor 28 n=1 Tax=Platanthera guangdongensis TaxID=2320717 RepID=A0ABR2MU54_9ASPA